MTWNVAQAKQRFSEVLRRAQGEPQLVYRRKELVAVILAPHAYEEMRERVEARRQTLAEVTEPIRAVMRSEGYELEVGSRADRPNPFASEA